MSRARNGSVRVLLPTLRRLHCAELVHLRAHAARLQAENQRLGAELERAERELEWADDRADMFQDALNQVEGHRLALRQTGELFVSAAAGIAS